MKIPVSPVHIHTHTSEVFLLLSALLFSTAFCLGQTCPPDNEAQLPPQEELADNYQPKAYDPGNTTVLRRLRFTPPGYGMGSTHPTVLTIPPTVFRSGDDTGTPHQRLADYDLAQAGYLVFSVEHRLAPPGMIKHQQGSGRPPEQSDDIKQQILAALADPHCNQKIFLVGGSSGGTHALWAALDNNYPSIVPGWTETVRGKIKAVVGLSGIYDLSLRVPPPTTHFIESVQNYTNTTDSFVGLEFQYSVSPLALVVGATNIPPTRLYATESDSVPWQQGQNMKDAVLDRFPTADIEFYEITGSSLHAFNYWHAINNSVNPPVCVSTQVIAFLNAHL